jgi:hypothetical protein
LLIRDRPKKIGGERIGIARKAQERSGTGHLWNGASRAGHHRGPGDLSFENREAEAFVERRVGEALRVVEQPLLALRVDDAETHDSLSYRWRGLRDAATYRFGIVTVTSCHDKNDVGVLTGKTFECGDQNREVLASFDGSQREDERSSGDLCGQIGRGSLGNWLCRWRSEVDCVDVVGVEECSNLVGCCVR